MWNFRNANYLTGRFEIVDKDELFSDNPVLQQQVEALRGSIVFRIESFTAGFSRDFKLIPGYQTGVGANFTLYSFPDFLKPYYGDHPAGVLAYFRIRQGGHSQEMTNMKM